MLSVVMIQRIRCFTNVMIRQMKTHRPTSYKLKLTNWYVRKEPDWDDPQLENAICYTMFCANGYVRGVCGTGCTAFSCFCDRCYTNEGTSYEDMEKAWAKKNRFTMLCSGWHKKCVNI